MLNVEMLATRSGLEEIVWDVFKLFVSTSLDVFCVQRTLAKSRSGE